MSTIDEDFILSMREYRARGMISQASLAKTLQGRGLSKMTQATIWSIEAGRRRVTLAEAINIALVLGFTIPGVDPADEVRALRRRIDRARMALDGEGD